MKIFTTSSIALLDAYTIEHEPIESIDLMERAARALTAAIAGRYNDAGTPFVIFAGPGNNGGDALAVARLLAARQRRVAVYLFNPKNTLSPDCLTNKERLLAEAPAVEFHEVALQVVLPKLTAGVVVIDGLFGSGVNKPLAGGFASVVKYINASPAHVVSIDMPSGLMGEDNSYNTRAHIIHADLTLSLQLPKLAFLFAENEEFVGRWETLDIGLSREAIDRTETDYYLTEIDEMKRLLKPRNRFAHKGNFGHALIIAGQQGMAGAAILSARACLRAGAGLLTVHVPLCNNPIVQTAVPEAMTELDAEEQYFACCPPDTNTYQVIAVGPGIGQEPETEDALLELIDNCQVPMVIDADAINLLGTRRDYLNRLPSGTILTPHPKELDRLVGKSQNSHERLMKAIKLAHSAQIYIIIKGHYSCIVTPKGTCYFNPTGNPGMATGGSGDVLTGIVTALLAQGYASEEAARLATFVHGMAGDDACLKIGETAMTASDIVNSLPAAWKALNIDSAEH
ncbi:MAG: NAD(P)H-hydrate dehydratase [Prevotellaceae bacterium]|jgi:NAD(P)H-hydrate epimerase|nr:NAD(P)H-hydrate dehydratase [Prevotellaceae bacterium]